MPDFTKDRVAEVSHAMISHLWDLQGTPLPGTLLKVDGALEVSVGKLVKGI